MATTKPDAIRKRLEALPSKLYCTGPEQPHALEAEWHSDPEDRLNHTVSPEQNRPGWCTDGGYPGYGIPRPVAESLAHAPTDIAYLLRVVEVARDLWLWVQGDEDNGAKLDGCTLIALEKLGLLLNEVEE